MIEHNSRSPFFIYILCMVSYFTLIFENEFLLTNHLELVNLSSAHYEQIILFKLLGSVGSTIMMLLFIQRFFFKQMIICSIFLYWISFFSIIFIKLPHIILLLAFFTYAASTIIIPILLLGYIFIDSKISNLHSISTYMLSILIASIISTILEYLNLTYVAELITLNIILMGIFLIILTASPLYNHQVNLNEYRFFPVLKHMEIETLIGFVIFYCIVRIEEDYIYYATLNSLTIFDSTTRIAINLFSILIAITISIFYMDLFNKHKFNIISLIILIFVCLTMPSWNKYIFSSICGRLILITTLYGIFASSLLLLAEKFRGINIFNALIIYALGAILGYYCGYITENAETEIEHNQLLISICFVLVGLLIYYLYFFKKHKLYR